MICCERCLHRDPNDHVEAICEVNGVAYCGTCVSELQWEGMLDDGGDAA